MISTAANGSQSTMTVHSGRRPMLAASIPAAIQARTPSRSNGTPLIQTCTPNATSHIAMASRPRRRATVRVGRTFAGTASRVVMASVKLVRLRQPAGKAPSICRQGRRAGLDRAGGAEPPIARGVREAGLPQMPAIEVRPGGVDEHQLGVGGLPEQEVRGPLLTGRADEQVDVGQAGLVEMRGDRPLVDLGGVQP